MRHLGCFIHANSLPIGTFASTCSGQVPLSTWAAQSSATLAATALHNVFTCLWHRWYSVESLATRYQLSTFQPKSVDGGISGFAFVGLSPDEGLTMGSFNVSMQSIWRGRQCFERLTFVKQLHSGFICLCHVLNPVQLTDELFCIVNLGRCEVSFSEVLK